MTNTNQGGQEGLSFLSSEQRLQVYQIIVNGCAHLWSKGRLQDGRTYVENGETKTTEDKVKLVVAQAGVKKNPAFGGSDRDYCYIHLQLPYEKGMANVFIGMYHFQVFSGPMDVVTAIFDEGSVNADAFMRSVKAFSQK